MILQIFVTDTSAQESAAIANAVAAQLAKSVGTLSPAVTQGGTKQLSATVVAQAPVPRAQVAATGKKQSYAEGLVGGLVIGVLLVLAARDARYAGAQRGRTAGGHGRAVGRPGHRNASAVAPR